MNTDGEEKQRTKSGRVWMVRASVPRTWGASPSSIGCGHQNAQGDISSKEDRLCVQ